MSFSNSRILICGQQNILKLIGHCSSQPRTTSIKRVCPWIQQSCQHSSEAKANFSEDPKSSENDNVNPNFINRNPRNLEQMGLASKQMGWKFTYPNRSFFHRLQFEVSKKHTRAYVEHYNGSVVLSASTNELAITKHLYSNTDVSAAVNVGRVIAQRCRESGLTCMVVNELEHDPLSTKFTKFVDAVKEGGIELTEPETIVPDYEPGINYDNEEEVENLHRRQKMVGDYGPIATLAYSLRKRQRKADQHNVKDPAPPIKRPSE